SVEQDRLRRLQDFELDADRARVVHLVGVQIETDRLERGNDVGGHTPDRGERWTGREPRQKRGRRQRGSKQSTRNHGFSCGPLAGKRPGWDGKVRYLMNCPGWRFSGRITSTWDGWQECAITLL